MIPTTYWAALLLTILTMLCWGSWANTTKLAGIGASNSFITTSRSV